MQLPTAYRVSPFLSREHWTYTTQGFTHDGKSWFVSNTRRIFRFDGDLTERPSAVTGDDTDAAFWQGEFKHISGIDYWAAHDVIVGAVEHDDGDIGKAKPGYIAVWDKDLRLITKARLQSETLQNDAPWCAINPADQLLYMSKFHPDETALTLEAFKPEFDGFTLTLTSLGERPLYSDGKPVLGSRVQAGCFTPEGHLYLAVESFGVMGFDLVTGHQVASIPIPLRRQVEHWWEYLAGYFIPGTASEELEGVVVREGGVYALKAFYAGFASVLRFPTAPA